MIKPIGLAWLVLVIVACWRPQTATAGDYSIGVLNIQSKTDLASASNATNFSVLRVRRNILRRSAFIVKINRLLRF